jgi:hypothetical protein
MCHNWEVGDGSFGLSSPARFAVIGLIHPITLQPFPPFLS